MILSFSLVYWLYWLALSSQCCAVALLSLGVISHHHAVV